MDGMEIMRMRHSVRQYEDRRIDEGLRAALKACVDECNAASGLHIQLCFDEPRAFDSFMGHYGSFRNAANYIALAGRPGRVFSEACGYYGERVVLKAQELGLNTCWVALTYSKGKTQVVLKPEERLRCVIALGFGATQGTPHRNRPMNELCRVAGPMPDWFRRGMEAALLAPTAMNQQKFLITLDEAERLSARAGAGFCARLDLGIVKYHFEQGSGHTFG